MFINFVLFSETCIKWELEEHQQFWVLVEANPGQQDYGEGGQFLLKEKEGGW